MNTDWTNANIVLTCLTFFDMHCFMLFTVKFLIGAQQIKYLIFIEKPSNI